jgi:PKHD-type hydroxylase
MQEIQQIEIQTLNQKQKYLGRMNKMYSNVIFEQALSEEDCANIIEESENILDLQDSSVGHTDEVMSSIRKSKNGFVSAHKPEHISLFSNLQSRIWTFINLANRSTFGFDVTYLDEVQYTVYDTGDYYNWHSDLMVETQNAFHRKLSVTIQLSDDTEYEGGDFELHCLDEENQLPKEIIRKKGSIIIFPSFMVHRVTPVTKGTRKSLVAWVEGRKWK